MIVYRCFPWTRGVWTAEPEGPLWFPRQYQGEGRHDNPSVYGCLYLTDRESAGVVEQLAQFRGGRLVPSMLVRAGLPLALASVDIDGEAEIVDLDDPGVLEEESLRPSLVATRERTITQPQALDLYLRHEGAAALRWWSVHESLWVNLTFFDRAARLLRLVTARRLELDDPAVREAADFLGLA